MDAPKSLESFFLKSLSLSSQFVTFSFFLPSFLPFHVAALISNRSNLTAFDLFCRFIVRIQRTKTISRAFKHIALLEYLVVTLFHFGLLLNCPHVRPFLTCRHSSGSPLVAPTTHHIFFHFHSLLLLFFNLVSPFDDRFPVHSSLAFDSLRLSFDLDSSVRFLTLARIAGNHSQAHRIFATDSRSLFLSRSPFPAFFLPKAFRSANVFDHLSVPFVCHPHASPIDRPRAPRASATPQLVQQVGNLLIRL